MSLVCPNCGHDTSRLITRPDVDIPLFCEGCRPQPRPLDGHLYSGRKCWAGQEVYKRETLREKAWNFEQTQMAAVKEQRRRMRPSTRKAIYGE